jgi:hypothetical protein
MNSKSKESKPLNRSVRIGIISGMTLLIIALLGAISFTLLTADPTFPTPGNSAANSPANTTNTTGAKPNSPDTALGAVQILVGPPDHQVDIAYPTAVTLSMNGPDIPTPETVTPYLAMGAFATTDNLTTIETYYSQKLKAAGYDWDWEDACAQDTKVNCPESRYFTADIYKCVTPATGNVSSSCAATYQVNFWLIGANAKAAELKTLNIPQSLLDQLKPGQTLVAYSANSLGVEPNNATMAVTTAAAVPTPTRGPLPTTPTPLANIFVGPDNAFHVSQFDNNPEKQAASGASFVTTGDSKPVKFGTDGTFQLNWLISEEGIKTTLQATVVTPHNTAYTASKLFDNFGFAYLGDEEGRGKIPVHLVNSSPVNGATNTFIWTMETTPLPPDRRNLSLNFEPALGIVAASPIQLQLKTYTEAGLAHPVSLQPQTPGGQANGLWLVPQYAYFGPDRTILSLAFQPDVFKDKEAYRLIPQLVSWNDLKVTDNKGRVLDPLDPSQPFNPTSLVLGPVASDTKSLKIELAKMVVGRNLNQPTTSLENAPVTHLSVPVADLLKTGQTISGPVLQTPGIKKLSIELMGAKLDESGEYVTITVRYRATDSLAYPPALVARSVGFSCEKCGQENSQWPVSSRMLPDGAFEFTLTYKYDAAQTAANLKVDMEQFWLLGPWQFEAGVTH